jgi:hypothetical protein
VDILINNTDCRPHELVVYAAAVAFWEKLAAVRTHGAVFKTVDDVFKHIGYPQAGNLSSLVTVLADCQLALDLPALTGADATSVATIKRYAAYTFRKCSWRNQCGLCFH